MALVEIMDVRRAQVNAERLLGFNIDVPAVGTTADVYAIEIGGWVVGRHAPAVAVEIHAEGAVLRRVPVERPRPDVATAYPDVPAAAESGFRTWVGTVGLEPGVDLQLRVALKDGSRVRLGAIRLKREGVYSGFVPRLQPLMLTTLGRAGTTWTMRLLSEHPQIAVHRWHPYELRTARYWFHMLKVLSEPADPLRSAQADYFQTDKSWVGHNPFAPELVGATPGLDEWFGRTYVEELAAFAQRSAEECYTRIAAAQGQEGAVYFAEKHRPDYMPWLVWDLYPKAKEIFLVRDFRDVISSMLAFNRKQGRVVFGHSRLAGDEEFARFVRNGPVRLLARNWPRRQDRAHLVRYEDLIQDPTATLGPLLAYLDLERDEATIAGMVERALLETADSQRHRTSGETSASIGRWRTSLSPEVQAACQEVFGDVLEQFGYAP